MREMAWKWTLVTVLCLVQLFHIPVVLSSQDKPKLVCYMELWSGTRPSPANYDLSLLPASTCDYLVLMYLTLDETTWTLRLQSGYGDVDPELLHQAAGARDQSPAMKVLVAVGGWEDGVAKYSDMISEESRRQDFISSVVETLDTYKLDGLELHWLYPGAIWRGGRAEDKDNFLQLVKELKAAFEPHNWILTASVPPDEATLSGGYDVLQLDSLLHQFHVRTIDLRGHWLGYVSNHCPLNNSPTDKPNEIHLNVDGALSLWMNEGASSRKLLATFPFYGRSFTLQDKELSEPGSPSAGPGKQTDYIQAAGLMAYFEICEALKNGQLERHFQSGAEAPYAVMEDQWVGYDDEESLQRKAKLLSEKEMAGAAVFALGLDDFRGTCGQSHFLLHKLREFLDEQYLIIDVKIE